MTHKFDLEGFEKHLIEKLKRKPQVSLIGRLKEAAMKPRLPKVPKI